MIRRTKETFYYVGQEIPHKRLDRYRCLDAATRGVLLTANKRILFILVGLTICFIIIIGRLFYLTIVDYQPRSFTPSVLKTTLALKRHNITDRNGLILALSLPTVDLSVNPQKIKDPEETARQLVKALPDLSYESVYQKLTSPMNFQYIKRNLVPREREAIKWIGNQYLEETKNERRFYPQGSLFSHILGGVNIDNVGTAGLEKAYDRELATEDIRLSLDTAVQEIVRQSLMKGISKYKADGGLGLVMNVHTGELLAAVSLPDYDPNLPADGDMNRRFNKATLGTYEFGSVFKLFNTAMALENGDIRPTDTFDTSQTVKIGRKVIEDYRGENRRLTVPEILIHSSNIGSVQIALKSGWQKQQEFLGRFGFYDKLPIRLPELGGTQYPTGKRWADMTSANVAFGYGISVTPLHLIAGVAALVNGGYYRVPTLMKDGNRDRPVYQVLKSKTSEQIRHMMWAVINWDMKESNPVAGYAVGGKTGSANLLENGRYVQGRLRTSFVGAFPMNDPQYVVLITLENPKKIKETWMFNTAGWNAKPIGLEIISRIAPYVGVQSAERWVQPAYIDNAIASSKQHKKR